MILESYVQNVIDPQICVNSLKKKVVRLPKNQGMSKCCIEIINFNMKLVMISNADQYFW